MSMNPVHCNTVEKIMEDWSKGATYAELSKKYDRSVRSIEATVTNNRGTWTRDFNFPHILHAKRFGA